uniref:Uncharacterized protein n=1 Tax=uncultured prokaryote TaxID=198431 RepID=A0A0H5Q7K6_9ZZZZ|nr:hypothetical protein [uncultured prokaryote]
MGYRLDSAVDVSPQGNSSTMRQVSFTNNSVQATPSERGGYNSARYERRKLKATSRTRAVLAERVVWQAMLLAGLPHCMLLTAMCIAELNGRGVETVSHSEIADKIGRSVATVKNHLRALEAAGLVMVTDGGFLPGSCVRRRNSYLLRIDGGAEAAQQRADAAIAARLQRQAEAGRRRENRRLWLVNKRSTGNKMFLPSDVGALPAQSGPILGSDPDLFRNLTVSAGGWSDGHARKTALDGLYERIEARKALARR